MTCTGHRIHCGWCRSHPEWIGHGMPGGVRPEVCPEGFTVDNLPVVKGLGSTIERVLKPIAQGLGLDCYDASGHLDPASPCGQRRDKLNGST